ncbi:MAG: DNA mismatch repair protein MutS, partial [Myxococcota bacterium]|nr:DNA mismatch repair protein MutS [Myxococcota bacterium]
RIGATVLSPCDPPECADQGALAGADAMLDGYLARTRIGSPLPIKPLEIQDLESTLRLGPEAVRNLELLRTLQDGRRKGSVLGLLDHTRTAMGGRRLKQWLLYPLTSPEAISERHDMVEALVNDPIARASLREDLQGVYDLERLITRVVAGNATPRDVEALASSLERVVPVSARLEAMEDSPLARWTEKLDPVEEAVDLVRSVIVDAPPPSLKDGGVIREGFHPELDELLVIARDGKAWFNEYADSLREQTGINSLKVRFNQVFGYFIEVTKANLHNVPDTWLRKQTLANAERYYTPELKDREEKVLGAHDRRIALEVQLFERVRLALAELAPRVQRTGDGLAGLDVFASMAELAQRRGYVRPGISDDTGLRIVEGRHPVIEALVPPGEFVPNDVELDTEDQQIL